MNQDCIEARNNYWFVVDNTISAESLKVYNEHLSNCIECRKYVLENEEMLKELNSLPVYDLDEQVYKNMLFTLEKKRSWLPALPLFRKKDNSPGRYIRYAFTLIVIIITTALVLFFNSKKQLPHIGKPVIFLDWKAEKIEHSIHKIDSSLVIIKTKTIKKNIYQNDPWKSNVYLLARDIERMQTELDKSTL